jgi:hypothetical protein
VFSRPTPEAPISSIVSLRYDEGILGLFILALPPLDARLIGQKS